MSYLYRCAIPMFAIASGVARQNFDGYLIEALPGRRVAQYQVGAGGFPRVHIVSLTLNGR